MTPQLTVAKGANLKRTDRDFLLCVVLLCPVTQQSEIVASCLSLFVRCHVIREIWLEGENWQATKLGRKWE